MQNRYRRAFIFHINLLQGQETGVKKKIQISDRLWRAAGFRGVQSLQCVLAAALTYKLKRKVASIVLGSSALMPNCLTDQALFLQ